MENPIIRFLCIFNYKVAGKDTTARLKNDLLHSRHLVDLCANCVKQSTC